MSKINKLSEKLISKIAAGEVVERPSSILKELLDNSIDSGATKITVEVWETSNGIKFSVTDDGSGIPANDIEKAFQNHTTSKLKDDSDLLSISTLGFRGEALASIASVTKVEIISKTKEEKVATKVLLEGGKVSKKEKTTANEGTKVTIFDIFYNVPARKKFLKTYNTEYRHLLSNFYDIVLANLGITFTLYHKNKKIIHLPKINKDSLSERVGAMFKMDFKENFVKVDYQGVIEIFGLISRPIASTSNRKHQYIMVNGRPVNDKIIQRAISEGFKGYIANDKYPQYFLYYSINPKQVDVNVHPRKLEVKFVDQEDVFRSTKEAINYQLSKTEKFIQEAKFSTTPSFSSRSLSFRNVGSLQTDFKNRQTDQVYKQSFDFGKLADSNTVTKQGNQGSRVNENLNTRNIIQVFNMYIILEKEKELIIIDQHAAAERITYEKLKRRGDKETKDYLIAEVIELENLEKNILLEHKDILAELGLLIDDMGRDSIVVRSIPESVSTLSTDELLKELAASLSSKDSMGENHLEKLKDNIITTMACHHSIRAGMHLARSEMQSLVTSLLQCDNPYSCPHGRPIVWELTKNDLDKKFERI